MWWELRQRKYIQSCVGGVFFVCFLLLQINSIFNTRSVSNSIPSRNFRIAYGVCQYDYHQVYE